MNLYNGDMPVDLFIPQKPHIPAYIAWSVFIALQLLNINRRFMIAWAFEGENEATNFSRQCSSLFRIFSAVYFLITTLIHHKNQFLLWQSVLFYFPLVLAASYLCTCAFYGRVVLNGWIKISDPVFYCSFCACIACIIMLTLRLFCGQPIHWVVAFLSNELLFCLYWCIHMGDECVSFFAKSDTLQDV